MLPTFRYRGIPMCVLTDRQNVIFRMPVPHDECEQGKRIRTIKWLMLSHRPTYAKRALSIFMDMRFEQETIRLEVLIMRRVQIMLK